MYKLHSFIMASVIHICSTVIYNVLLNSVLWEIIVDTVIVYEYIIHTFLLSVDSSMGTA